MRRSRSQKVLGLWLVDWVIILRHIQPTVKRTPM